MQVFHGQLDRSRRQQEMPHRNADYMLCIRKKIMKKKLRKLDLVYIKIIQITHSYQNTVILA